MRPMELRELMKSGQLGPKLIECILFRQFAFRNSYLPLARRTVVAELCFTQDYRRFIIPVKLAGGAPRTLGDAKIEPFGRKEDIGTNLVKAARTAVPENQPRDRLPIGTDR